MKRTGFTLMELLLVVAILAIVAAAAAPTFTGGAAEALAEARKSSFMSAFQNTVSGCNLMLSVYAAKGVDMSDKYKSANTLDSDAPTGYNNLEYYVPAAARTFKNNNGEVYMLSAGLNSDKGVDVYYSKTDTIFKTAPTGTNSASSGKVELTITSGNKTTKTTSEALDTIWKLINGETASSN